MHTLLLLFGLVTRNWTAIKSAMTWLTANETVLTAMVGPDSTFESTVFDLVGAVVDNWDAKLLPVVQFILDNEMTLKEFIDFIVTVPPPEEPAT